MPRAVDRVVEVEQRAVGGRRTVFLALELAASLQAKRWWKARERPEVGALKSGSVEFDVRTLALVHAQQFMELVWYPFKRNIED